MKVHVAMPSYNDSACHAGAVLGQIQAVDGSFLKDQDEVTMITPTLSMESNSVLPHCFNILLCRAINDKADFFAMLHADVVPLQVGWVDKMLGLMETRRVDVISAVIPFKNNIEGLTSTGVSYGEGMPMRRLTMREVHSYYQKTFWKVPDHPIYGKGELLVNTGCMVIRLKKTRKYEGISDYSGNRGNFSFRFQTWNEVLPTGEWYPNVITEDYLMTQDLRQRGARIEATIEVPLYHQNKLWQNTKPWGIAETDKAWEHNMAIVQKIKEEASKTGDKE